MIWRTFISEEQNFMLSRPNVCYRSGSAMPIAEKIRLIPVQLFYIIWFYSYTNISEHWLIKWKGYFPLNDCWASAQWSSYFVSSVKSEHLKRYVATLVVRQTLECLRNQKIWATWCNYWWFEKVAKQACALFHA
jgi:hypothetical protein